MRVLLVEDNDQLAIAIGRLLTRRAFEVVRAADGVAAREQIESGSRFDAIVSDVDMPRLGGLGLLLWLRANREDLARRSVFMTGEPDAPAAREISETYARPVLGKPISPAPFFAAIDSVLDAI